MPARTPKSSTDPSGAPDSPYATALRTASCGELTAADVGRRVVLTGWVAHRREHWDRDVHDLYEGRFRGDIPRPPRTLAQQNDIIKRAPTAAARGWET